MQPHIDPTDLFGADLIQVFGPKAHRRHISTLTAAEKTKILELVPVYVDTSDIVNPDGRCSFYQITNKILKILSQTRALYGIDLDWCTDLRQGIIVRHDSAYKHTKLLYKNNSVQRGIWLRHMLADILFSFTPDAFLSGLARELSDGTYNLNNGQHRTIAAIIAGVREIPLEYVVSDKVSVDIDLYATDNLTPLAASDYDIYRIRVRRIKERRAEGRTDFDREDVLMERIHDLHDSMFSKFVEKGSDAKPLECTAVGNMIKYYKEYGHELYRPALDSVCTIWYKSPISTANCWGFMEFFKQQREQKGYADADGNMDTMFVCTVQDAIAQRYSDPSKSGMHHEFKRIVNNNPKFKDMKWSEPKLIAGGIYKIVKAYNPDLSLAPIMDNGNDVAQTFLGDLRIMPLKKLVAA